MRRSLTLLGLAFVLISTVSAQNRATFTVGTATATRGQKATCTI